MTDRQFDPHWPHGHETMDGKPARIVCHDAVDADRAESAFPLVVLVTSNNSGEHALRYMSDGCYWGEGDDNAWDLRNRPAPKPAMWTVVFTDNPDDLTKVRPEDNAEIYWDEDEARRRADDVQKRWNYVKVSKFEEVPL